MIQKPSGSSAKGIPPTFMPKKPATMLIGRASTVTMVRVKRMRLFCSLSLAAISSCSSLIRSPRAVRSLITRENSSVASRNSRRSASCSHSGGRLSRRSSEPGSSASRRCRRTSTRRMAPRSARLAERRRASSWSSMRSTATLVSRTIWVSTSPWSRNRWISNCRGERKGSPCFTEERSLSTERSGCARALTSSRPRAQTHRVATSEETRPKLKTTSLTTASSAESTCSMRVERDPSRRLSKK